MVQSFVAHYFQVCMACKHDGKEIDHGKEIAKLFEIKDPSKFERWTCNNGKKMCFTEEVGI